MKKITLTIFGIFLAVGLNAQWTRTNVSANANVTIESMCVHNDNLYAALFDSGLVKLNTTTQQWETVQNSLPPSSNSAHITHLASSGNYLYAYVNDQFTSSTTIYRSANSGITFVTDSVGHPLYGPFPAHTAGYPHNVHDVFVLDGQIFNIINGGAYTKKPADAAWVRVTDASVKFAESFGTHNNTWYATYGSNFFTSTDNGATWVEPANTGLNTGFSKTNLNVNPATGRIYVANSPGPFDVQKLFYSDNEGATWDSLPINQYIKPSALGGNQKILGMISKGSDMHLMLTNDAAKSTIDVLKSTDGGLTFSVDTVGLPFDQFGASAFVEFIYFNNQLWFAPNKVDIYVQGAGTSGINNISKLNVQVYPNPAHSFLQLDGIIEDHSYVIFDMSGREMKNGIISGIQKIDLQDIPAGMYFLKIENEMTIRFVKE